MEIDGVSIFSLQLDPPNKEQTNEDSNCIRRGPREPSVDSSVEHQGGEGYDTDEDGENLADEAEHLELELAVRGEGASSRDHADDGDEALVRV